ncbi:uncharacterized protein LOC131227581 [Magnolia sinica]|uniref:uncharacterized protein LOC131227581 n=1 Tax=Magnolia sinica TaxID=86752 RepID=UPI00265A7117|nr:uncharacterized protein LOC131227581 [Magnolia sinica]
MLLAKINLTTFIVPKAFSSARCFHHSNFNWPPAICASRYHGTQHNQNYGESVGWYHSNDSDFSSSHVRVPRNGRTTPYNQVHHYPSRSDLRHYGHSPKVLSSGSYSVLQSSGLQHWFKNWQELRKHKLTASTFGGAVGFWPGRRVQLWLEKIGLIEPFTGNLATCWSNIQEEVALERYKLITGNSVCFPEFQVYNRSNKQDDWLAASPDGVVEPEFYGLPSGGVLEVKCPFENGEVGQSLPWSRIPLHFMPQAQGLMEILDKDWMDFYIWTPNGSSLFRLQRDQKYWELLKLALSDFWWKHVQPAKELCKMDPVTDPFTVIEPLKPAPRHELCRSIICASKCLVDDSRLLVREIHGRLQN